MKTMWRGMGIVVAVSGLAAGLSGCASSKSAGGATQNTLLGSRNLIPPPYVRPAEPPAQGPFPLIPPRAGVTGAIPAEPLPADTAEPAFVPAEAPVFVGGPNADEVIELPAPGTEEVAPGTAPAETAKPEAAPAAPTIPATYTVRRGDTMGAIALAHGVRWQDIAGLNPDVDPNRMRIGSVLKMPVPGVTIPAPVVREAAPAPAVKRQAPAVATLPADGVYTVVSGDNLSKLAQRFKIKVADIREWNGLQSDLLQIGQKLKLRGDSRAALPPPAKPVASAEVAPPATPVAVPGLTPPPVDAAPATPAVPAADALAPAVAPAADAAAPAATPAAATPAAAIPAAVPAAGYVDAVISTDGETLENLAKMYATTVAEILRNNPHIKTDADLKRGTTLKIVHY